MLQYRIQIIWYGTQERRAKIQAASDLNSTQRTPMASPWVWSVFYCSSLHCSAVFCFGSVFYCSALHYSSVFWLLICSLLFIDALLCCILLWISFLLFIVTLLCCILLWICFVLFLVTLLICILLWICFLLFIVTLLFCILASVPYCSSLTSLYSVTWPGSSIELYLIVHCCFASLYSCIILACRSIIVVLLHFSMMKNLNVTIFLKLDKTNENHS